MADYISREDYCEENCGKENREGYKTCKNCSMLNVPSADVQPVRRGWWIWNSEPELGNPYGSYLCSKCGNRTKFMETFCCDCGARMEEEVENETD